MISISAFFEWFGEIAAFCGRLFRAAVLPPYEWAEFLRQCDSIGSLSLPLVALAGAATGVVLSMETRDSLSRFGAKSMLPAVIEDFDRMGMLVFAQRARGLAALSAAAHRHRGIGHQHHGGAVSDCRVGGGDADPSGEMDLWHGVSPASISAFGGVHVRGFFI